MGYYHIMHDWYDIRWYKYQRGKLLSNMERPNNGEISKKVS